MAELREFSSRYSTRREADVRGAISMDTAATIRFTSKTHPGDAIQQHRIPIPPARRTPR